MPTSGLPVTQSSKRCALERLRILVERETGLQFRTSRLPVLEEAVGRRIRALGLGSIEHYLLALDVRPDELGDLIDALTVGETAFFRQRRVFDALSAAILPEVVQRIDKPARIWSAGCSSGEEAYSLAICALDGELAAMGSGVEVLGTDINARALSRARLGVYPPAALQGVPPSYRDRYFESFVDARGRKLIQVNTELHSLVRFERHNLVDDWWPQGPWDVVVCQNVVMYFDPARKCQVLERLYSALAPGGWLIVSPAELPAEPLFGTVRPQNASGVLVYRRR